MYLCIYTFLVTNSFLVSTSTRSLFSLLCSLALFLPPRFPPPTLVYSGVTPSLAQLLMSMCMCMCVCICVRRLRACLGHVDAKTGAFADTCCRQAVTD